MPAHHFLRIAYDGTAYRGWQRQPGDLPTVQQTLEDLLSRVHHRPVAVGGCGRTDAGVHATQFYAYHRSAEALPADFRFFVNKQLPRDIRLLQVHPVAAGSNARFAATERTYDYFFHGYPDAFLERHSFYTDLTGFDPAAVRTVLEWLPEFTEYRAFCKAPDRHNTTIVHFRSATLYVDPTGTRYRLRFVANRFLRGMIRLLVNDLLRVGRGELSSAAFRLILTSHLRPRLFRLAPPEGLFLTGVRYPFLDRPAELPVSAAGVEWRE